MLFSPLVVNLVLTCLLVTLPFSTLIDSVVSLMDDFVFDNGIGCRFYVDRKVVRLLKFDCLLHLKFGLMGRSFYDSFVVFEGHLLTNCFLLVPLREDRVFVEDHVTALDQFPVLRVP